MAELCLLSTHCTFASYLDEALRDWHGVWDMEWGYPKKTPAEVDLTLKRAMELAQGMEAAEREMPKLWREVRQPSRIYPHPIQQHSFTYVGKHLMIRKTADFDKWTAKTVGNVDTSLLSVNARECQIPNGNHNIKKTQHLERKRWPKSQHQMGGCRPISWAQSQFTRPRVSSTAYRWRLHYTSFSGTNANQWCITALVWHLTLEQPSRDKVPGTVSWGYTEELNSSSQVIFGRVTISCRRDGC